MAKLDVWSFEKAVRDAESKSMRRSILLGNGFSIDYDPKTFSYQSLAADAELRGLSVTKKQLFNAVGSQDFEVVVDRLRVAARLARTYGGTLEEARRLRKDARIVRNGLADVLAHRHPRDSLSLSEEEVQCARVFLHGFRDIYTLNYDMLLYWVINRPSARPSIACRDGFWPAEDGLEWSPKHIQRVHYLHGALHYFVEDKRLRKLRYTQHGPIVQEVKSRLRRDEFPLIVTEGSHPEKVKRIRRSSYLRTTLQRFGETQGALFIHGVSMSENDDHVFEKVEAAESKINALYIGIYGTKSGRHARAIMHRSEQMKERRKENGGSNLRIRFYDTATANVWRG